MENITIPRKLAKNDDLVIVPKKEYEALLELKKIVEFSPSRAQKQSLMKAENNLKRGKTISYNELVRKLGFAN